MDYAYIHHVVDVLRDGVDKEFQLFPLVLAVIFLILLPVFIYRDVKKSKNKEVETESVSESLINPKVDKVVSEVLASFMIVFFVFVIALMVVEGFLDAHDRRVEIKKTKTWQSVTATILDASAEEKYIGGKSSEYDHCYHIQVGYDINQTHYTSEIEFLDPCEPNLVMGADYNNAARYYYPLHYTLQVFIDPSNPRHIRDMSYIKSNG